MWEWTETLIPVNSNRVARGGAWNVAAANVNNLSALHRGDNDPTLENNSRGFRVAAAIPEANALAVWGLLGLSSLSWLGWRTRK